MYIKLYFYYLLYQLSNFYIHRSNALNSLYLMKKGGFYSQHFTYLTQFTYKPDKILSDLELEITMKHDNHQNS